MSSAYYEYLGGTAPDPEGKDWGMFSPEGTAAVAALVDQVSKALQEQAVPVALKGLRAKVDEIGKAHGEVTDTAVREEICYALDKVGEAYLGLDISDQVTSAWYGEEAFA